MEYYGIADLTTIERVKRATSNSMTTAQKRHKPFARFFHVFRDLPASHCSSFSVTLRPVNNLLSIKMVG